MNFFSCFVLSDNCESSSRYQNQRIRKKDHGGRAEASCADETSKGVTSNTTVPHDTRRELQVNNAADQGTNSQLNITDHVYHHIDVNIELYATLTNSRNNTIKHESP
jgi:hypothetical protein